MSFSKTYSFKIQPQFVDFQFRVTLGALSDILLTTAGMNADDYGFGLRHLHDQKCSWVLLRLAVEMDYFPEQYQTIHVETWIEEIGRASTTRNFCIRNNNNEIIGNACSIWAMLDMETRRAKDLQSIEGIHNFASGTKGSIAPPIKLAGVEDETIECFKVKYSDIDINQHVNSVRYIEWISNCFTLDFYRQKSIKRFEINYMNEMVFDDDVKIAKMAFAENDFRFEIKNNDKASCRARVLFTL